MKTYPLKGTPNYRTGAGVTVAFTDQRTRICYYSTFSNPNFKYYDDISRNYFCIKVGSAWMLFDARVFAPPLWVEAQPLGIDKDRDKAAQNEFTDIHPKKLLSALKTHLKSLEISLVDFVARAQKDVRYVVVMKKKGDELYWNGEHFVHELQIAVMQAETNYNKAVRQLEKMVHTYTVEGLSMEIMLGVAINGNFVASIRYEK